MSAWGIGTSSNETESSGATEAPTTGQLITTAVAAFVKWIPAEVVAGYGAFVAANWVSQTEKPSAPGADPIPNSGLWYIALIATPLLVFVAGLLAGRLDRFIRKAVLAPLGFALWSASIPHSYWNKFEWFKGNEAGAMGLMLILGGVIIAGLGEWILSREIKNPDGTPVTNWRKYL